MNNRIQRIGDTMTEPILIAEDDPMQRQMLSTLLRRKMDYSSCTAENGRDALNILDADTTKTIKLIILDLDMPVMGGMETLEIIKQRYPSIPVIMLTGSNDVKHAVKAMKLGATDFITKPYNSDRMTITIKNALKISLLSREVTRLKSEKEGTFRFENIIGHDGGLLSVITTARKAASSDISVLITGETGTGKEVLANAIHGESARVGKPFIAINCGAIPAQLVESTLFGHEKGSFTGATEKAIGKFREAEGGTIFLDEVSELPLDTQVKLLRVLQQKEVEPVGGSKPIPVNVRIISATNRDLENDVKQQKFREDLFFRLNVLQIPLPALRDRKQDIAALTDHLIDRFCVNEGGFPKTLSDNAKAALISNSWPGNVRQLENTINRAMVMSDGNMLELTDFSALLTHEQSRDEPPLIQNTNSLTINIMSPNGTFKTARDIEKEAIAIVLQHLDHNVTQSAKALGMAKSTFYKKIK